MSAFIPYVRETYSPQDMIVRSRAYHEWLNQRRSLRAFSEREVPREVIGHLLMAASSAPSGAHKQPWTFCAVSDPALKQQIRLGAEEEERRNYQERMPEEWLEDLQPFDTDWNKPFLETAPWLIVVFKQIYGMDNGKKRSHYYVNESVGLACGFLLTAIHHAGLVALTHTPSPMNFLAEILERPAHERPYLLIPVGYPPENAQVPDLRRKSLDEVVVYY